MLYLYDKAVTEDLINSFDSNNAGDAVVRVIPPDEVIGVAAQIQDDNIKLPIVAITRNDYQIDQSRTNFTMLHKGIPRVADGKNNEIYNEKICPITLGYKLTVLATNTADSDELVRELIFKYTNMYYLTIKLPYESKRHIRFGIKIDPTTEISRTSSGLEYLQKGQLYQTIIPLTCEGCVLLSYTPIKMTKIESEIEYK